MPKETPVLTQYNKFKSEYKDHIVMFQMGKFFLMFSADAYIAAEVLGLNPIGRNIGDGRVPACGVPVSAVEKYADLLNKEGYAVAICAQNKNGAKIDGVKARFVEKVLTPDAGVLQTVSIEDLEYDKFVVEFEKEQEKKKKPILKIYPEGLQKIYEELKNLDLENMSPNMALAHLYHWKKTYCDTDDGAK